jgi:hypothetical protein
MLGRDERMLLLCRACHVQHPKASYDQKTPKEKHFEWSFLSKRHDI